MLRVTRCSPPPGGRVGVRVRAPARTRGAPPRRSALRAGTLKQIIFPPHPPSLTRSLHSGKVSCVSLWEVPHQLPSPRRTRGAAECSLRAPGPPAGSPLRPRGPGAPSLSAAGLLCRGLPHCLRTAGLGEVRGDLPRPRHGAVSIGPKNRAEVLSRVARYKDAAMPLLTEKPACSRSDLQA